MERATINEVLEKRMHIIYNADGEKKIVFGNNTVKELPFELQNVLVSDLQKKLNDLENEFNNCNQQEPESEIKVKDESTCANVSGEAITEVAFIVSRQNQ